MASEPLGPHAPSDWAELIQAVARCADRDAFAALFGHYAPRVKSYLRRMGLSDGAAEELAQETLLAVWRKADLFDPAGGSASAWIFAIARNLRIDMARRSGRVSATLSDIDAEFAVDPSPLPDNEVARHQASARLHSALSELSAEQMQVVELSFFQSKAHGEIATVLGLPLGTVKSRLRLAMAKLRGLLGDFT